jgi:hypothetical protein
MKFLDKKEQVLDIQMTPYGEYLLSQGKFKPEYYAFYDDNILYESQYSGYVDNQNNIEPRTQEDTPQLGTQTVFSDRDIFIRKGLTSLLGEAFAGPGIGGGIDPLEPARLGTDEWTRAHANISYFERHRYGPQHCLGKSDVLKTDTPAWSVSMFRGEITGSARAVTGSTTHTLNIPQLDVTLTYKINTVNEKRFISDSELAIEYPNGQFLDVRPEIVLSQVIERNAEFTKENFDIEVFEVMESSIPGTETKTEKLRPLKFKKPYSLVQGDILLDEKEIFTPPDTPPTTEDVEYYFDIRVDGGISEQLICSSISELESRGLYVDTEIVCEDVKNISLVDIYSTDAAAEPCPDDAGEDPCDDRTVY